MITLDTAGLVVIASRTLGLDTAQVLDLLDPAAAERALEQEEARLLRHDYVGTEHQSRRTSACAAN